MQVILGDHRHVQHYKAGHQRLVQLTCSGVAVVHGADEAGGGVKLDALIAGNIDDAAEVQRGMQHRQRLVLRHVHLVQHAEAAQTGALADGALPEHHLAVLQGVRADQGRGVHVHIHGHIPVGTAEHGGKVLRQHVLAGGLGACQQQMLAAQQRRRRALPDLLAVVQKARHGNARLCLRRSGILAAEMTYFIQKRHIDALVLKLFPNIHGLTALLRIFFDGIL